MCQPDDPTTEAWAWVCPICAAQTPTPRTALLRPFAAWPSCAACGVALHLRIDLARGAWWAWRVYQARPWALLYDYAQHDSAFGGATAQAGFQLLDYAVLRAAFAADDVRAVTPASDATPERELARRRGVIAVARAVLAEADAEGALVDPACAATTATWIANRERAAREVVGA